MSSLSRLEALDLGNTSIQWETDSVEIERIGNASLEELMHLSNLTALEEGCIPKRLFHTLTSLEVCYDEYEDLPLGIIQRIRNLEKLSLYSGSYTRIFSTKGVRKQAGTLGNMKELALRRLEDLKYMWKQDSKLDLILQNLEVLEVDRCESLISLLPRLASFQNLTSLEVEWCNNLMNLMASSTAKSLVQLAEMRIMHCYMITEVIENEQGRTEEKISFSKLKSLSLECLPSLKSFCCGHYTIEFPSLEKLTVEGCNRMKIFSQGVLSTPALRKVKINWKSIEPCWDVELKATIQQLYEEKDVQSSDTEPFSLHLSDRKDEDYGDFSRHGLNDQSFDEDSIDSYRKSDEDNGGSSRHDLNNQSSDEDSSGSSRHDMSKRRSYSF